MECHCSFLSILISVIAVLVLGLLIKAKRDDGATKNKPPGPPGWPVVGNMFDLGTKAPHQNLYNLRFIYGPVFWLRLGSINTMVIQSAKAASELFQNHDLNFSDRKVHDVLTARAQNEGSMAMGNYGKYWRVIRKFCSMELLNAKRMDESASLRRKCVDNMTRWIEEDSAVSLSKGGLGDVEISKFLFLTIFNVIGNMMLSKDLLEPQSEKGKSFSDAMDKCMKCLGKPNVADFFPILKPLDLFGIRRNMLRAMRLCMNIVDGFIKERIQEKQSGKQAGHRDFLDALMEYDGDGKELSGKIPERKIKIIILEMFLAGVETTSSTIEWSLTELLRSPVMKETLRLHPPVPLLLPRNGMEESNFMGYHIPKGTQVYVNVWAIGRDPESWSDPLSFTPERFLNQNIEYKGKNFELIPFGAGRRVCVGYPLAHRVMHLVLATLLQSFDWKLTDQVTPETMDMNERFGISLRKLVPLKAIPEKRNIIH